MKLLGGLRVDWRDLLLVVVAVKHGVLHDFARVRQDALAVAHHGALHAVFDARWLVEAFVLILGYEAHAYDIKTVIT